MCALFVLLRTYTTSVLQEDSWKWCRASVLSFVLVRFLSLVLRPYTVSVDSELQGVWFGFTDFVRVHVLVLGFRVICVGLRIQGLRF